jgi:HlyD family secretion protein
MLKEKSSILINAANKEKSIPLRIVSPSYIFTAYFFVFSVLALLMGSFFLRAPVIVDGHGILMAEADVMSFAVMPASEGRLEEYYVKAGDKVIKGQKVARVSILRLENEIETARLSLDDLRHKEKLLNDFHRDSLASSEKMLKQLRLEDISRRRSLTDRMARLEKAKQGNAELIKKGFLSSRGSDQVSTEIEQVEDSIFSIKRQLMESETNFSELLQKQQRETLDIQLQIKTQLRQYETLLDKRKSEGVIFSPEDGVVSELFADLQQPTSREKRVATVTPIGSIPNGKNLVKKAVVFIPAAQGKKVNVGMPARLLPLIYEEQQFGRIEGIVTEISTSSSDEDSLMKVIKNLKLVRKLFETEAPYKVTISVVADLSVKSGLSWTSSRGPDRLMEPGTLVSGWIVYDQPRVLYLLLPSFKRLGESAWVNLLDFFYSKKVTSIQ